MLKDMTQLLVEDLRDSNTVLGRHSRSEQWGSSGDFDLLGPSLSPARHSRNRE